MSCTKNARLCRFAGFLVCVFVLLTCCSPQKAQERESIHIAMPYNAQIQDVDTNYYKLWLEKQTGLDIEIEFIPQDYTGEYLRLLFTSEDENHIDAVFFDSASGFPSMELVNEYGTKGYILPLNDYIHQDSNLHEISDWFDGYNFLRVMSASDGNLYYVPALDTSAVNRNGQTLWLNASWMKALGLSIPQTTEDLTGVLTAFRDRDPNGNGIADEIPLTGSAESQAMLPFNFLINSFVYNDWVNSRMAIKDGSVFFAPVTEQWRQAMIYCRSMYEEELLPVSFSFNREQLVRLANDPRDLIGGFTASGINEVLFQSSPEVTSRFTQILPLIGPGGVRFSVVSTSLPLPGGVITASCKDPEAAFFLMDTMLSEEASVIGRYGEQGTDWDYAEAGSISPSGAYATITVKNFIRNKLQNKTLLETGPFVTRNKYVDGVAWRGFQADHEYINVRGASSYRPYEPEEYISMILFDGEDAGELGEMRAQIGTYTQDMLRAFITGEADPEDDTVWECYIKKYESLGLDLVLEAIQKSYAEPGEK